MPDSQWYRLNLSVINDVENIVVFLALILIPGNMRVGEWFKCLLP